MSYQQIDRDEGVIVELFGREYVWTRDKDGKLSLKRIVKSKPPRVLG